MRQEQVSLNDSIDDDEEEQELKGKNKKKKGDKKKKQKARESKKQTFTPQNESLVLDPVELMPSIKIG